MVAIKQVSRRFHKQRPFLFYTVFYTVFCALFLSSSMTATAAVSINEVRMWTAPDHTRLVLDLSNAVQYDIFRLHAPERIVIDIKDSTMKAETSTLTLPDPVLLSLRHGNQQGGVTRIVLDVNKGVSPRTFLLKKSKAKPHRLVVDLIPQQTQAIETKQLPSKDKRRDIIVAVDAGHGGEDPGAIGRNRLQEKDVTLKVAKDLAKLINAQQGMKAVLVRTGDYYISLKGRVNKVRGLGADMMISIHADAITKRSVKGASVYTLSESGATPDRVAAALAAKENAADEIGGEMPEPQVADPFVRSILGDMAKRDGLDSSEMFANILITRLRSASFPIKYSQPKHARFAVLTTLEIPCVLVEVDYISNPQRERLLNTRSYQKQLAQAMSLATVDFFTRMGRFESKQPLTHTVHKGESLWSIAQQYGVSVSNISKLNNLNRSSLRVGQRLRLPPS